MDYVPSNPSGPFIYECEKNHISKYQHDPTVDARDMATEALLVHPNPAPLCNRILYRLSPLFVFLSLFFFFNLVAFAVFKGTIVLLITFMSLIYVFIYYLFFFSWKPSGLFLLKSLVFTKLSLGWYLSPM